MLLFQESNEWRDIETYEDDKNSKTLKFYEQLISKKIK